MRVLSIDVGIRNLGVCVVEGPSGTIIDWKVIDLCGEQPVCSFQGRRRACEKPARFSHKGSLFCRAHASANGRVLRKDVPSAVELTSRTPQELGELARRHGVPHEARTHARLAKDIRAHMIGECPSPLATPDASSIELTQLARVLQTKLDDDVDLGAVDEIIIENQISPIAGRMKCMQAMLAQYFAMKTTSPVRFVSASIKLRDVAGQKATYAQRKKLGIQAAAKYLENTGSSHAQMFESHQKQDDLADSLLQALGYMSDSHHIPWMFDNADYLK